MKETKRHDLTDDEKETLEGFIALPLAPKMNRGKLPMDKKEEQKKRVEDALQAGANLRDLALKGVSCVLTVDSRSNELTNLYIRDTDLWRHLLHRFGGNKMTVTLRGPHDYERGLRMPPDIVIDKLDTWISEDGELDGIIEIVEEICENDGRR